MKTKFTEKELVAISQIQEHDWLEELEPFRMTTERWKQRIRTATISAQR